MAASCRWGVESGKLMYPSTFVHVPACVYMSHRPNESFVPKQQRYTVDGKTSDKNLEQRISIKFYAKIGKSASKTIVLLTVAYDEYAVK
jgi:hypothetical protein